MSESHEGKILVVDDEPNIREVLSALLTSAGYDVTTAKDGFDALLQLKRSLPDVVISDLNMPQMSGFELLSVVRRRFPQIMVIAMSGAYDGSKAVPAGVIADSFYAKSQDSPQVLIATLANLIRSSSAFEAASTHTKQSAPVWIPRNGKDSNGIPFIVITCTECLRSFPLHVREEVTANVLETACLFCPNTVRYIIDFSRSVNSPHKILSKPTNGKT